MSTLINVINNVDSEIENLSWRKKFRFHNRKLLKFGIFEHKTSIVSSRGNLTLFHIICDSEIELKTHYFENAYIIDEFLPGERYFHHSGYNPNK